MEEQNVEKFEVENEETLMEKTFKKVSGRPGLYEQVIQPCLAELIGTAFFVFIGCLSVIENLSTTGHMQPALVHGLAAIVLIACLGEISGSHLNPPFTLAIYLCGGVKRSLVLPYVVCQLIGGVFGAAMAKLMTTKEKFAEAQGAAFTLLQSENQVLPAVIGEVALTCLITLVVLMGAVNNKSKSPLLSFLAGLTIILNVLAGANVSGACMNPARALGPALMSGYWTYHWVYWVGPFIGSLIATALVRILLGDEKLRILWK